MKSGMQHVILYDFDIFLLNSYICGDGISCVVMEMIGRSNMDSSNMDEYDTGYSRYHYICSHYHFIIWYEIWFNHICSVCSHWHWSESLCEWYDCPKELFYLNSVSIFVVKCTIDDYVNIDALKQKIEQLDNVTCVDILDSSDIVILLNSSRGESNLTILLLSLFFMEF